MDVKLSRHARRRAKLYKIPEAVVVQIFRGQTLAEGQHEFVRELAGLRHPVKVIVVIKNDLCTVVTNYPLKRGRAT